MGHDNNIVKLMNLLVKFHRSPSFWLCLQTRSPEQSSHGRRKTIKLVKSDGSLEIYDRPVAVSELTKDFPKHMICRSDSFYIGQKTPALSESDRLQPGHSYFLLPLHFFQSVLSFVSIAALNPENGGVLVRRGSTARQPFHIQKGPSGSLRIRVSEDFISELIMEKGKIPEEELSKGKSNGRVCTTAELQKDYAQLVVLRRRWKPKLETIRETKTARTKMTMVRIGRRGKESQPLKSHRSEQKSNSRVQSKSKFKYRIRKSIGRK